MTPALFGYSCRHCRVFRTVGSSALSGLPHSRLVFGSNGESERRESERRLPFHTCVPQLFRPSVSVSVFSTFPPVRPSALLRLLSSFPSFPPIFPFIFTPSIHLHFSTSPSQYSPQQSIRSFFRLFMSIFHPCSHLRMSARVHISISAS